MLQRESSPPAGTTHEQMTKPPTKKKDPDAVKFGTKLREAREAAGLSQSDLAKLVKIPQPRLPGLEQGRTDVRLSTIRRFAKALGVRLKDLLPPD
jgi:ribosome-binding protein aMBF1 (putative translation factor)